VREHRGVGLLDQVELLEEHLLWRAAAALVQQAHDGALLVRRGERLAARTQVDPPRQVEARVVPEERLEGG
jgi:hypothetical protein